MFIFEYDFTFCDTKAHKELSCQGVVFAENPGMAVSKVMRYYEDEDTQFIRINLLHLQDDENMEGVYDFEDCFNDFSISVKAR